MSYTPVAMYPPYLTPYQSAYPDQLSQLRAQQLQAAAMPNPMQQTSNGSPFLWVQGEAGAKSYLITPGTTVLLMDSEMSRFYIKSADGAGMPNLRTFEYKEITGAAPAAPADAPHYVTRDEFREELEELKNKLEELSRPVEISPIEARRATRSRGGNADESSV